MNNRYLFISYACGSVYDIFVLKYILRPPAWIVDVQFIEKTSFQKISTENEGKNGYSQIS